MGRARTAALTGAVVLLAAGAGAGGFAATKAARGPAPIPSPSTPRLPGVYASATAPASLPATGPAGTPARPAAVAGALAGALRDPGLGTRLRAEVEDVRSGATLLARGAAVPAAPASTAKLLVAAAVLSVRKPTDRIVTRAIAGRGGALVLVGGGDPTLTGAVKGKPGAYAEAARLSDLARAVRATHARVTRIVVDDGAFTGPRVSPYWAPEDVPSDYAGAITPTMTDGGRSQPNGTVRSADPDLVAGQEFAAALGRPGLPVSLGSAPAGGRVLASVHSAPIATLVEQMLHQSDNVIAECLARQVAVAEHAPPSFAGAAQAVRQVLRGRGLDPGGGMVDGSGLAARDRLSTSVLAGVLRLAATSRNAPLRDVLSALPVAAWTGTLSGRYLRGATKAGAGVVRAKTGTLTGVSSLAGVVHDRDGRLLAFAFIADQAGSTEAADAALDAIVARLARCGCG